jgi:hypothetical protein
MNIQRASDKTLKATTISSFVADEVRFNFFTINYFSLESKPETASSSSVEVAVA